ncbi:hypothetical protein ISN45_Aa01g026280 [Arabidopsis thaliana x Arabidopsis arenosa]|uniref:Uncharacterized protein n=1 Tax=Arabidopsis thaliana x Arabidopsis arenosa TaxID=1240361 RepID=A0A8T2CF18_9BRAS|nr:hypothetical protein ISN45_Aa01g026280 [Arabidopsis thaliana x Arabidopsis arenosa]
MAMTLKTLVRIFLTILFIIFSIHCRTTTADSPGYGIGRLTCFDPVLCIYRGGTACDHYCKLQKYRGGLCTDDKCCCVG